MIDQAYVQLLASYNRWMNERLLAMTNMLDDEVRRADRGAFFKSLHGTLDHLIRGDRNWLARFKQQPAPVFPAGDLVCTSWPDLVVMRRQIDDEIDQWAARVSNDWLQQPFRWHSPMYQRDMHMPAWIVVTHFFNHQTHHRGQVTTLLSQLGIDPGITDLPMLPTLEIDPFTF